MLQVRARVRCKTVADVVAVVRAIVSSKFMAVRLKNKLDSAFDARYVTWGRAVPVYALHGLKIDVLPRASWEVSSSLRLANRVSSSLRLVNGEMV